MFSSRSVIGLFFSPWYSDFKTISSNFERLCCHWKYYGLINSDILIHARCCEPHRTTDVFSFFQEYFDCSVIALNFLYFAGKGIQWPPYSLDFIPCGFFLWGHLKDSAHRKNLQILEKLEKIINDECVAIPVVKFRKMPANFVLRLRHLTADDDKHFQSIVMWFSFIKRFKKKFYVIFN